MRRLAIMAAILALLGVTLASASVGSASVPPQPSAAPGIYDSGNTGTVASAWVKHLGEPDPNDVDDVDRYGLLLFKNATPRTLSAPFAIIKNVA
jgi:transposase